MELLSPQRALFDVPDDVCYLNCAYMSPQLESVRRRGEEAVGVKGRPWTLSREHWFERVEEARTQFAAVVGASGDDIALVPSASYGIGTAVANIPLSRGQRVLVIEDQFPSCVYPWRRKVALAGAELVTVAKPDDGDWTPAILEALDDRCAAVTLPANHWTDGARIDLVEVGARARQVGAQLVLDLSQSAGADPIDVRRVDPDWLCAPAYKWLLGPYSIGFLYVAPRNQGGVPIEENWIVRSGSEDFSKLVDYTDEYVGGARRYDVGERSNFVLVPMVNEALAQVLAWGVDRIAATLRNTTAQIASIAAAHGFEGVAAELRAPHIIGLERPSGLPADLIPRLAEHSVYVGRRGDHIRIAPHVHVTDADLQRFDEGLSRVLP